MASKKQIEANRKNSKKSTGPKTEEGKAKSSMNALKHGLTSQKVWLNEEEKKDFHEFRLGLVDEMEPWGSLETQFVCRIAAQMWRLARVPGIEAELLEKMSYDMAEGEYTSLGEAFHRDIATYDGSLGRLARYEAILDRSLHRLLNQYRKIQADRLKREERATENWDFPDWRREDFSPEDAGFSYQGGGQVVTAENAESAEKVKEKNKANGAEGLDAESGAVGGPSPATGTRTRRGRHGSNGMNGTNAGGHVRTQHATLPQPPSV